jgi:hypothetical protein
LLDTIFRHLHQDQLAAVKSFILETKIDFSINYPRKDMQVPSLVLLLKNEGEAQTFLGDILGDGSSPFVPDPELMVDTLGGHAASTSGSSGLPRKILGPLTVDRQEGSSTIYFEDDQTAFVEELLENPIGSLKLYVVQGSGAGYVYDVLRIRNDSLDIADTFEVNLDDTSVVDLRVPHDPELAVGEPSRVYQASPSLLRKGVNYEVTYHLQVIAGHQDQVIYLYSVVKALLLSQRVFLESQGIQVMRIGGSDFAPRSEFLPNEVFQRQMTLTFTYPFSFLEEQETFSQLVLDIVPEPVDDASASVLLGVPITLTTY